ncbi:hypothetical protein AGMMS49992_31830 [Clostridia bacterium]|nr:hypothetical protein AGMMS49992_31830 [Clostridia bacterium]
MPTAKRLPSGNYRVRVMIDGKVESFTCATKREAEYSAARAANASKEASRHPERISVGEAADRFLEHRKNLLSPSTIIAYKRIRRLYMQSLVPLHVSLVRSEDLQEAVNAAAAKLSPKTVRNVFTFFTAVIKSVRPDVSFKVILPQKRKIFYADAEDEDVARLVSATQGKTIQTAIVIAAFTGMRRSEIAGLKREDIDAEGCVIHVRRALVLCEGGKWCEKSTKNTESERDIDVSAEELHFILDRDSGKSIGEMSRGKNERKRQ